MAGKKAGGTPPADQADEAQIEGDGTGEALPPAVDGDQTEQQSAGWDAEGEHSTAIDRMENMADELDIDTDEMVFDVRDFLLDTIKARPKPWSGTSQAEQRDVAAACEHAAKELVRKVAEAIAANGTSAIRVLLTKVNMGSDIVISGKVKTFGEEEEDAAVLALHRAIGKHVMLTRASADDYMGGEREAATDADEPDFGFEGEGDEDD
ncbi:hypothetical protein vBEliSR6L_33 [Erythrobacter phage vB_EliS_R6L]|nr:hypothetical protein vBEliSR6L_33 [Erythrobacter phage vB_EliS_R6L]